MPTRYTNKYAIPKTDPSQEGRPRMNNVWQVTVDNMGTVFIGNNGFNAIKTYNECVSLSKSGYGRMSGENVYLIKNGEINKEYHP